MTIIACFTLAAFIWAMLAFQENTHPLIYATMGLLIAMGSWHIQTLWRTLQLRKHFKKPMHLEEIGSKESVETGKLLDGADLENIVPVSVIDHTTKELSKSRPRSA
jgi:cytochrome c biogenesis protein CcdA